MRRPFLKLPFGATLLVLCLGVADAVACLPVGREAEIAVASTVPRGGGLSIGFYCVAVEECTPDSLAAVSFQVLDERGAAVPGAIVPVDPEVSTFGATVYGSLFWMPENPFAVGASYSIALPDDIDWLRLQEDARTFVVIDQTIVPATTVSLDPEGSPRFEESEPVCCVEGIRDSCDNVGCYSSSVEVSGVAFYGTLQGGTIDDQLLYRLRTAGGSSPTRWFGAASGSNVPFALTGPFCVVAEMLDRRTGAISTVGEHCLDEEHANVPDVLAAREERLSARFRSCTVPPEGFEEDFCKTFEAPRKRGTCEGSSLPTEPCEAALDRCGLLDEPRIEDPPPSGCSVRGGTGLSRTTAAGFMVLVAAALVRRRLRPSRHGAAAFWHDPARSDSPSGSYGT